MTDAEVIAFVYGFGIIVSAAILYYAYRMISLMRLKTMDRNLLTNPSDDD